MSDPKPYPIAPEILETRDHELQSRLPGFYPYESDLQIAEQILVPQLRSVISEALANFNSTRGELALTPPSPAELPKLCAEVDKALDANRNLLDAEGLGKPLFDYIQSVRESMKAEMIETFRAHCRSMFAAHGVTDRASLLEFGPTRFKKTDFSPYSKGFAFVNLILCEAVGGILTLEHLSRIADILGWPEKPEEERLQGFRSALAVHGIRDRNSFIEKGADWFRNTDFPPYGKGCALAGLVLGEGVRYPSVEHLSRIADILGWPERSEEERFQGYRSTLGVHGIVDRNSLLTKGSNWFRRADFPPYGKGNAFASLILGERAYSLSHPHLRRIADILGWPEESPEEKAQDYRAALGIHGIADRSTLLAKGPIWFMKTDFPPYGKGKAFAGMILCDTVNILTLPRLRCIADILGWHEESPEEKAQDYRAALVIHGVADRATLLAKSVNWYVKTDFCPYGKGTAFASLILGDSVCHLSLAHLRRIADILFPEKK